MSLKYPIHDHFYWDNMIDINSLIKDFCMNTAHTRSITLHNVEKFTIKLIVYGGLKMQLWTQCKVPININNKYQLFKPLKMYKGYCLIIFIFLSPAICTDRQKLTIEYWETCTFACFNSCHHPRSCTSTKGNRGKTPLLEMPRLSE